MTRDDRSRSTILKRIALGAIGTVLLGAIGSGVWQLVFSPGVDWFGDMITAFSRRIEDAAYASAAMDPRPIPSLMLFLLVVQIPLYIAGGILGKAMAPWLLPRVLKAPDSEASEEENEAFVGRAKRLNRNILVFLFIFMLGIYFVGRVGWSVANRSVWIWRVYHTSLDLCAPYLTDVEEERLLAQFRAVETKHDYALLSEQLESLASVKGIDLIKVSGD